MGGHENSQAKRKQPSNNQALAARLAHLSRTNFKTRIA